MKNEYAKYIPILRGLISYHERMRLVCKTENSEAEMEDLYLEALKESLRLMEARDRKEK